MTGANSLYSRPLKKKTLVNSDPVTNQLFLKWHPLMARLTRTDRDDTAGHTKGLFTFMLHFMCRTVWMPIHGLCLSLESGFVLQGLRHVSASTSASLILRARWPIDWCSGHWRCWRPQFRLIMMATFIGDFQDNLKGSRHEQKSRQDSMWPIYFKIVISGPSTLRHRQASKECNSSDDERH